MMYFGFLTDTQAQSGCVENLLIFDMWEIIAPKVERDLAHLDKEPELNETEDLDVSYTEDTGVDSKERSYRKEVRAQEVNLADVKGILMAILKINDGKTFVETDNAPLPQSEGEIGFRDEKSGLINLRYDELPKI